MRRSPTGPSGSLSARDLPRRTDMLAGATIHAPAALPRWVEELPRDRPIAVYCICGFQVGGTAVTELRQRGYDARALVGGITAWHAIGGATVPLDTSTYEEAPAVIGRLLALSSHSSKIVLLAQRPNSRTLRTISSTPAAPSRKRVNRCIDAPCRAMKPINWSRMSMVSSATAPNVVNTPSIMAIAKSNPASGTPRESAKSIAKSVRGQGTSPATKPTVRPSP